MRFPLLLLVVFNSFMLSQVPMTADTASAEPTAETELAENSVINGEEKDSEPAFGSSEAAVLNEQTSASATFDEEPPVPDSFSLPESDSIQTSAESRDIAHQHPDSSEASIAPQTDEISNSLLQSITSQMQKQEQSDHSPLNGDKSSESNVERSSSPMSDNRDVANGKPLVSRTDANLATTKRLRNRDITKKTEKAAAARPTKLAPRPLVLRNAGASPIHFLLDKALTALKPGDSLSFKADKLRRIQFHRGNELGDASFSLRSGIFEFQLSPEKGWKLARRFK